MAFVNARGEQCTPTLPMKLSAEEILRSQDITIVRMRKRNLSWRAIGRYLNLSHTHARRRYYGIPTEAREHYARLQALG